MFTHDGSWKHNVEQNYSKDSEVWGGKLKNGAGQIVCAALMALGTKGDCEKA